jgi:hypothetical protein
MYTVDVRIKGVAPLMQHRFPMPDLSDMSKGGKKSSGAKDYTQEWRDYLYVDSVGQVYQPSSHIEGALVKAAVNFKVTGKRGKSYKDLIVANVIVDPERIPHVGFANPDELDADGDKPMYLDVRPVIIQRARVVRIRPCFKAGWELEFEVQVNDDEIQPDLLQDILALAGKAVGIGDYRPKFGRFQVIHYEVHK